MIKAGSTRNAVDPKPENVSPQFPHLNPQFDPKQQTSPGCFFPVASVSGMCFVLVPDWPETHQKDVNEQ